MVLPMTAASGIQCSIVVAYRSTACAVLGPINAMCQLKQAVQRKACLTNLNQRLYSAQESAVKMDLTCSIFLEASSSTRSLAGELRASQLCSGRAQRKCRAVLAAVVLIMMALLDVASQGLTSQQNLASP